jgi:hypothetical protein
MGYHILWELYCGILASLPSMTERGVHFTHIVNLSCDASWRVFHLAAMFGSRVKLHIINGSLP